MREIHEVGATFILFERREIVEHIRDLVALDKIDTPIRVRFFFLLSALAQVSYALTDQKLFRS